MMTFYNATTFFPKIALMLHLLGMINGYSIDEETSSLSLCLLDMETKISPKSLLFVNKKSSIMVEGLEWMGEVNDKNDTLMLNYTTYINDEHLASGTIQLSHAPLELPTTFNAGTITADSSGPVSIRVVLNDGNSETEIVLNARAYREWVSSIPIIVAFGMFLIIRAPMIHSLFMAIFFGSWIIEGSMIPGFKAIFNTYLLHAVSNPTHASIILFIGAISVFMALVNKSGGTNEVLRTLSPYSSRARIAQLLVFAVGVIICFDSYASMLIVGKVFGSILKGFPLSCEKFAFLVDTTALPVSSIIPGSTWMVFGARLIQNEFDLINAQEETEINGESVIISSIKYQFYPILILILVLIQLITGREAGPILLAENEQRLNYGDMEKELETTLSTIRNETTKPERRWNWWAPVLVLNALLWAAFIQICTSNKLEENDDQILTDRISTWMTSTAATVVLVQLFFFFQPKLNESLHCFSFHHGGSKDTALAFLMDTFPSSSTSIPYAVTSRSEAVEQPADDDFDQISKSQKDSDSDQIPKDRINLEQNSDQVMSGSQKERCTCMKQPSLLTLQEGMESVFEGGIVSVPVILSLIFAWAASEMYVSLGIDRVVAGWILSDKISPEVLPILTFFATLLLSLILGSSWLTISILIPGLTAPLYESIGSNGQNFLILVLASILSGAIAGDHIGPFSETTIISGIITGCEPRRHFLTQAPYAIFVVLLSVLVGTLPLSFGTYPEFFGFFIGIVVIVMFIFCMCRRVNNLGFIPGRGGEAITKNIHPITIDHDFEVNDLIMAVNTADLLGEQDQESTSVKELAGASEENNKTIPGTADEKSEPPPSFSLLSFKKKLREVTSEGKDPILGLVKDGLLPSDIRKSLKSPSRKGDKAETKADNFQSKKRLIEATIKNAEKEGNVFSDSLRMFLRTSENKLKLDEIMGTESLDSGDDSLDNLMMDIATKGWSAAMDQLGGDDTTEDGGGDGYSTAGGYTTDGFGSVPEESDDSATATSTSAYGQSTAFTTDGETSALSGENTSEDDSTAKILDPRMLDPTKLLNPLNFEMSRMAFSKWINPQISSDAESTRDPSKASF